VTKPDHVDLKPLELVCGRELENLEKQASESLECCYCKQLVLGDPGGSSEDRNAERNAASEDSS
jgi:hypothetical protein